MLFRPRRNIVELAQSHAASLGLEPGAFCAAHVRRGDKTEGHIKPNGRHFAEGEAVPFKTYVDALSELAPQVRRIFCLTDDFREVAKAREDYPELQILTLCTPGETGFYQQRHRKLHWSERLAAVRRLIAEVLIAKQSQAFAGLYRSNVSLMVAAVHPNPKLCVSVDSRKIWRPA
jgi:hypothetical protein